MKDFTLVDKTDNFEDGEMEHYQVNGRLVLLSFVEEKFHAVGAVCTHQYAELVGGDLEEHFITCPLHFACFDIRTGAVVEPPATDPVPVFEVKVIEDEIWIANNPKEVKS